MVQALFKDPSSRLQAAYSGWKNPATFEWMLLAETFDLLVKVNSKSGKAKPIERPWPRNDQQKIGNTTRSRDEVIAALERMNPKET